jgi:hypothetical protein
MLGRSGFRLAPGAAPHDPLAAPAADASRAAGLFEFTAGRKTSCRSGRTNLRASGRQARFRRDASRRRGERRNAFAIREAREALGCQGRPRDVAAQPLEPTAIAGGHGDVRVQADTAHARAALAETLERGRRYREAGADGLFVLGLVAPDSIRSVAGEIDLPLNLLVFPGLGPPSELQKLGVRRVSAGSALAATAYGFARRAAVAFLDEGRYDAISETTVAYTEMNGLLASAGERGE